MSKANKVVIKNAPNYEDFVAILLNNGYTVTTKQVSGGDQIEISFYQEEQFAKGGVIPQKNLKPEFVVMGDGHKFLKLMGTGKVSPEEAFGKLMEEILESNKESEE